MNHGGPFFSNPQIAEPTLVPVKGDQAMLVE